MHVALKLQEDDELTELVQRVPTGLSSATISAPPQQLSQDIQDIHTAPSRPKLPTPLAHVYADTLRHKLSKVGIG
jgi:hypothetical protein